MEMKEKNKECHSQQISFVMCIHIMQCEIMLNTGFEESKELRMLPQSL